MERPKFFALELQSRQVVLDMLGSTDRALDLDEIFTFVKEKRGSWFTSDVVQHSIMSLLCDGKAAVTPNLKIEIAR